MYHVFIIAFYALCIDMNKFSMFIIAKNASKSGQLKYFQTPALPHFAGWVVLLGRQRGPRWNPSRQSRP